MTKTTQATREVELWSHTTCGLSFEVVDAQTGKSLTDRMGWCSDEDLEDEYADWELRGWEHYEKACAKRGWIVVRRIYS